MDTFKGLLSDMLPDRYGNELINLWLSQQGRPLKWKAFADKVNVSPKLRDEIAATLIRLPASRT